MFKTEMAGPPAKPRVLSQNDPEPFEIVNAGGRSRVVLLCEHAGRVVPATLGDLGIAPSEFDRHIAYDIGAEGVSRRLSELLDAPLALQPYSRLVVDCNRTFDTVDCVPEVSDTTPIPANTGLSQAERRARYDEIHQTFHRQVKRLLDTRAEPDRTVLVTIHSFTPRLLETGRDRPWELGLLYMRDDRFARRLMPAIQARRPRLAAAFNEPYRGSELSDYAIPVHGESRGIEHVLIEIRNDLIASREGQGEWAAFLADAIRDATTGQAG